MKWRQAPQQQSTKHAFHTTDTSAKNYHWEKNHPPMRYRDECMSLVSSANAIYLSTRLRLSRDAANNGNDFLTFLCQINFPCFLVHSPNTKSQTKRVCVIKHQCVCYYSFMNGLHEYKLCPNARTTTLEAGDAATCNAAV